MARICGVVSQDIQAFCSQRTGGMLRQLIACLRSPGLQAVICFRFGHWLLARNLALRLLLDPIFLIGNLYIQVFWGIELERAARIGPGFIIAHFGGITLSGAAVIGAHFNLCQCTTIGLAGTGAREGAPVIGDDVYVAPGARLFGKITIGNNVKIGANAVIYRDVPDNAVVGCEGFRILSLKGNLRTADPRRDATALPPVSVVPMSPVRSGRWTDAPECEPAKQTLPRLIGLDCPNP